MPKVLLTWLTPGQNLYETLDLTWNLTSLNEKSNEMNRKHVWQFSIWLSISFRVFSPWISSNVWLGSTLKEDPVRDMTLLWNACLINVQTTDLPSMWTVVPLQDFSFNKIQDLGSSLHSDNIYMTIMRVETWDFRIDISIDEAGGGGDVNDDNLDPTKDIWLVNNSGWLQSVLLIYDWLSKIKSDENSKSCSR